MDTIRKYLTEELGYESYEVDITIEDIEKVDQESLAKIKECVLGIDVSDYCCRDYTVERLMKEKGFNLIASIIAISNLKKDYDHYSELFSRPIK